MNVTCIRHDWEELDIRAGTLYAVCKTCREPGFLLPSCSRCRRREPSDDMSYFGNGLYMHIGCAADMAMERLEESER
jgi:hypothetical protein